ncbi:unannotated protein [freshwater metagenome]|uniref:Unannotated protein n=1 Tax=freshwater metagenome TaxID=449393 RepID=A0A6J6RG04_9ZZZZ
MVSRLWTVGQRLQIRARKAVKRLVPEFVFRRVSTQLDGGDELTFVGDVPITRSTVDEVIELLTRPVPETRPRHVHFTNAYSVVSARRDPQLAAAFQSGVCFPDGLPLVWAVMRLYEGRAWSPVNRVRGPDTFPGVLDAGQAAGTKHYLLGGSPDALEQLQTVIGETYPDALIVGAASPPFKPIDEVDWDVYLAEIAEAQADLVWVGLGTPKQDFVSKMLAERDPERTYLAVGAAFDFVAGTVKVAPTWMQKRGLEWLFRLMTEPRRLWRRYLIGNVEFVIIVARQLASRRRGERSTA